MTKSNRLIIILALVSLLFGTSANAQVNDEGSMQVGNATVSVGGGTAILSLPDVSSFLTRVLVAPIRLETLRFSEDFGDEIGWNVNGSIEAPIGGAKTVTLGGFWANINDEDTTGCTQTLSALCFVASIVDSPAPQGFTAGAGNMMLAISKREVDQWGLSLEVKQKLSGGLSGVTRTPPRRHLALGVDIRGIDQDLDVSLPASRPGAGPITYNEELDTRYYGVYAAWGGDFEQFLVNGLWQRWGLRSSFRLHGGIYYADTDYAGRQVDGSTAFAPDTDANLSLSSDDVAFIGGLTLETRKRIGQRTALKLRSVYEYYSYVPNMVYNTVDLPTFTPGLGFQNGTAINDDDAFSMRTSLRLTIGLGPQELYRETLN